MSLILFFTIARHIGPTTNQTSPPLQQTATMARTLTKSAALLAFPEITDPTYDEEDEEEFPSFDRLFLDDDESFSLNSIDIGGGAASIYKQQQQPVFGGTKSIVDDLEQPTTPKTEETVTPRWLRTRESVEECSMDQTKDDFDDK